MTTKTGNLQELARTLVRNHGPEATRQAEALARETFASDTAATARFLRDVLKAIEEVRQSRRS